MAPANLRGAPPNPIRHQCLDGNSADATKPASTHSAQSPSTDAGTIASLRKIGISVVETWAHPSVPPSWQFSSEPGSDSSSTSHTLAGRKLAIRSISDTRQSWTLTVDQTGRAIAPRPLTEGVYELRWQTAASTTTWRQYIPWESAESSRTTPDTESWVLVVLPQADRPDGEQPSFPRLLVRMIATGPQDPPIASRATTSHDKHSEGFRLWQSMNWLNPMFGHLEEDASISSMATKWQSIWDQIDWRINQIKACDVGGVWIDQAIKIDTSTSSEQIPSQRESHEQAIFECMVAKAKSVGLPVYVADPSNDSTTRLHRHQSIRIVGDDKRELRIADHRRSARNYIASHWSPKWKDDEDEFIWLGLRPHAEQSIADLPADSELAHDWLEDISDWFCGLEKVPTHRGVVIDEWLLNGAPSPRNISIRAALKTLLEYDGIASNWLPTPAKNASLIKVLHRQHADHTTLVCINRSPWAVRVVLPVTEIAPWKNVDQFPAELMPVALTPDRSALGARFEIPAQCIRVCQTQSPIANDLRFEATLAEPAVDSPKITQAVTQVVEHLGILSEPVLAVQLAESGSRRLSVSQTRLPAWTGTQWLQPVVRVVSDRASTDPNKPVVPQASNASRNSAIEPVNHSSNLQSLPNSPHLLLANGGFEEVGSLGIPGWTHAQQPKGAVTIQSRDAYRGQNCIRLAGKTPSGSPTWLISQPLKPTSTGRVAVALSTRCLPYLPVSDPQPTSNEDSGSTKASPIELRIAIEGRLNNQPIRKTEIVTVDDSDRWSNSRTVLQWLAMDSESIKDLRLTIDNLSSRTILVDEIVVTDYFASSTERKQLQSLAYLAVQGLQREDYSAASRLLQDYWAQRLISQADRIVQRPQPVLESTEPQADSDALGALRRLLPAPAWSEPNATPPSLATPPSRTSVPATPNNMNSPPENVSGKTPTQPNATEEGAPQSIARRLKSWIPQSLRF